MQGGAISLELTFRESSPEQSTAASLSANRSPKPRTGWYARRSSKRGQAGLGRGSPAGSAAAAAGWASTDADKQPLRWRSFGSDEVPAFDTCTLLPWLGGSAGEEEEEEAVAGARLGSGAKRRVPSPVMEGRWAEIGVYPPGDQRRVREALLLGYRPARTSPSPSKDAGGGGGDREGYVVALLVRVAPEGGVTVAEVCRAPLEEGRHPVAFNREKTPPGAPTNGRATAEAVCADGWVRRWCVSCTLPSSSESKDKAVGEDMGNGKGDGKLGNKRATFALSRVDICQPFGGAAADGGGGGGGGTPSLAALVAVASPTLLAVARSVAPSRGLPVPATASASATPEASWSGAGAQPPMVEVWSCAKTPYPRCVFEKEGAVLLPGLLRAGQRVEGMCWVSPEPGDERGAAVCGHCLCVSVAGSVTVLARERRQPVLSAKGFPGVAMPPAQGGAAAALMACLLYTSDAADE